MARLPSKLATVISATEEELAPSSLRPFSSPLSPSEWKKILLTKVLAQTIAKNGSAITSPNPEVSTARSMVGSVLLLDDALSFCNEIEEASIIKTLKKTGAATVISSNRWALGRFADRIIVMKKGKVLETGTHIELLERGTSNSYYASKWDAITSS